MIPGILSHAELSEGLRKLTGKALTDEHLRQIIEIFDKNGDGEIQYREFCDIFEEYDRAEESAGRVLSDLRDQLMAYGGHETGDELRKTFREFDKNRDGKLSADEFRSVFPLFFCVFQQENAEIAPFFVDFTKK